MVQDRYDSEKGVRMEKNVPFTTKEFDLLTFLAGHPNLFMYIQKEELFREIWDMNSDIATVTAAKKIREKIGI